MKWLKQTKPVIPAALLLFLLLTNGARAAIIDVTGFGARPNSFEDATAAVQKAIAACTKQPGAVLNFPQGRYDFWPAAAEKRTYFITNTSSEQECPSKIKTIGLLFEHCNGLTIEGNGSLLVFHGKMITLAFDSCTNIRLQHIGVDYERPTMSEMTFLSVSPNSVVAAIHPDSRFTILHDTLTWYGNGWTPREFHAILVNPQTGMATYSSWEPFLRKRSQATPPPAFPPRRRLARCPFRVKPRKKTPCISHLPWTLPSCSSS